MVWNKITKAVAALALCAPLLAMAAGNVSGNADGRALDVGVRLGAQISGVLTDAKWGPYPDITGPGGAFSFGLSRGITDHFYLHTELALDYRTFFIYGEIGIPCVALEGEEPCGGYWEGYDRKTLLYLEVPVMAQWRTSALFFEMGPVLDVMLYSGEEYILPEKHRSESDACYEDKRLGAGVAAGVGHVFDFGLSVDARVTFQFTDIVNGDKACLTMQNSESVLWQDHETGEIHVETTYDEPEYMGGTYYRLLKIQLGIGYWF